MKCQITLQQKLNMANGTVAELMAQVKDLQTNSFNLYTEKERLKTGKELADSGLMECAKELAMYAEQNEKLKSDYALLEEKYYTQSDNYTEVNKEYKDLLDKFTEISAENVALKAEIERTNRHINLAENAIHRNEQQPLVVNHYHNCVINK